MTYDENHQYLLKIPKINESKGITEIIDYLLGIMERLLINPYTYLVIVVIILIFCCILN